MSPANQKNLNDRIALGVALLSMVLAIVSGITFIANIDKTNAIQEAQISSINNRLDKIDSKIDKLFYKEER